MAYIVTYSNDRAKPIDDWAYEVFTDIDNAEQSALELLDGGYYVKLEDCRE